MQPSTPNCQQELRASLFRGRGAARAFKSGPWVALRTPQGCNPVDYAESLLGQGGLRTRDELRDLGALPRGRWIVRAEKAEEVRGGEDLDPLICAAILGLSGPSFYSLERPIIWTRQRLSRAISLHKLGGFYED